MEEFSSLVYSTAKDLFMNLFKGNNLAKWKVKIMKIKIKVGLQFQTLNEKALWAAHSDNETIIQAK